MNNFNIMRFLGGGGEGHEKPTNRSLAKNKGSDTPMHNTNLALTLIVIFNLLMPMSLLLISNKIKVVSCN